MNRDEEIVEYCAACGSLHLLEDDGHVVCGSCGAMDFYSISPSIDNYLKKVKRLKDDEIPS
jgi:uncharacterized Zn finger protein (UPF0148 family)